MLARGTIETKKNLREAKKSIEKLGSMFSAKDAKILNAYAIMGKYDLLFIIEAPDLNTAFELTTMIGTLGTLECETFPIMPLEDMYEFI